ncbi:MAG: hypothetical protein FE041_03915, partial [Thermoplasmata archaeon]
MKRLVAIAILFVLLQTSFAGYESMKDKESINSSELMEELESNEITGYLMKAGYPILPYIARIYEFPAGAKINVIVKAKNIEKRIGDVKIAPPPRADGFENVELKYETAEFEIYPEKWYDYNIGIGRKNGELTTILTVYLYPDRITKDGVIMHADDFEINIDYELPSETVIKADEYDLLIICPQEWENEIESFAQHKENHGVRTLVETV